MRLACRLLRFALDTDYPPRVERDPDTGEDWVVVTRDTLVSAPDMLPLRDWRALFVDQETGDGVRFWIQLTFTEQDTLQDLWVEVVCARNQQLKLEVQVRSGAALGAIQGLSKKSPLLNQRLTTVLAADAPEAVLVPPFYGTVPDEEYRAQVVIDRLLGSGDQSHVVRNLVAALEPEQFTRLNTFLRSTVRAELTYRTTGDALQTESPLVVQFKDSNGAIELSAAGAGLVNLVALFCALSRWRRAALERPVLFLLDEPEAHLHPRLQADASAQLAALVVQEFGAQLLLATHSVDILNRLSQEGAALLCVDRTASPSALVLDSDSRLFDDLRTWADLTPYTAINFLASRRVLFCEGVSDRDALEVMARLRFRNDDTRLRRFAQWARVRLLGASNAPISRLLTRLVHNEVVQRLGQDGGFGVIVVLDRDHSREPGIHPETVDGVIETTVVWSRHSLESLMLTAEVLQEWILAWIETWKAAAQAARRAIAAPDELPAQIRAAIEATNTDETLNEWAREQLAAKLATQELLDESGRPIGGELRVVHAMRRARELVGAQPEVWQRGKDRAARVLGQVREGLPKEQKNRFPTDILGLITHTDVNLVGNIQVAVPPEVSALLDLMARRDLA